MTTDDQQAFARNMDMLDGTDSGTKTRCAKHDARITDKIWPERSLAGSMQLCATNRAH
jgi:hypothetical protein